MGLFKVVSLADQVGNRKVAYRIGPEEIQYFTISVDFTGIDNPSLFQNSFSDLSNEQSNPKVYILIDMVNSDTNEPFVIRRMIYPSIDKSTSFDDLLPEK